MRLIVRNRIPKCQKICSNFQIESSATSVLSFIIQSRKQINTWNEFQVKLKRIGLTPEMA